MTGEVLRAYEVESDEYYDYEYEDAVYYKNDDDRLRWR